MAEGSGKNPPRDLPKPSSGAVCRRPAPHGYRRAQPACVGDIGQRAAARPDACSDRQLHAGTLGTGDE